MLTAIQAAGLSSGSWNANTNLTNDGIKLSDYYTPEGTVFSVSESGNTNLNGITGWEKGDFAYSTGTRWERIINYAEGATSAGTVTNVSIEEANGFLGVVSTPTSTPNITLSVNVSGLLYGEDGALTPAVKQNIIELLGDTLDIDTININNGTVLATPLNPNDIVNKAYTDAMASGLKPLLECYCATVGDIALDETTTEVDGEVITNGMRVLVQDQTNLIENGVYIASTITNWERATDLVDGSNMTGAYVFVSNGLINASISFVVSSQGIVGTDPMQWVVFSSPSEYLEGDGISILGRVISTLIANKEQLGSIVLGGALINDEDGTTSVNVDNLTIKIVDDKLVAQLPTPYTLPTAKVTSIGGSMYPVNGALTINETTGAVSVNVDDETIVINEDGKLEVIGGSDGGINNIHTPDNKNNTNSIINLLDGLGVTITSDGEGNITIGLTIKENTTLIYNTNTTLVSDELPLNAISVVINSSNNDINVITPNGYIYSSTGYGNSTTVLSLPANSSISLKKNASTIDIVGMAIPQSSTPTITKGLANLSGFKMSSDSYIVANDDIDLSTATVKQLVGLTNTGSTLYGFNSNNNYKINMVLNVNLTGDPDSSLFDLTYTGNTNDIPNHKYAINTSNMVASNGSIDNGIYIANSQNGTLTSNSLDIEGNITQYKPTANIIPSLCTIGPRSVNNKVYLYTQAQIPVSTQQFLTRGKDDIAVNAVDVDVVNSVGNNMGNLSTIVNPTGDASMLGVSQDNITILIGNTAPNKVYYNLNTNIDSTFIESNAIATGIGSPNNINSAIGDNVALFCSSYTNSHCGYLNLNTGVFTQGTDSPVFIIQLKYGRINTNTGVFVGTASSGTNLYYTFQDVANWEIVNLSTTIPSGYNINGIEYSPQHKKWVVTLYNSTTDMSTVMYSTTDNSITEFTVLNYSLNGQFDYPCGGYNINGDYVIITSKFTDNSPCIYSLNGGVSWDGIGDTPSSSTLVTYQCGMFIMTFNNATIENIYYSYSGTSFTAFPTSEYYGGYGNKCIGGNFIASATDSELTLFSIANMLTCTATNPTGYVYCGGQTLSVGISESDDVTFTDVTIVRRDYDTLTNSITLFTDNTLVSESDNSYIGLKLSNLNYGDQVTKVGSEIFNISNTFRFNAEATNGIVQGLYAQPYQKGNQQMIYQATFTPSNDAELKFNISYNNNINRLLDNCSLIIEEM